MIEQVAICHMTQMMADSPATRSTDQQTKVVPKRCFFS
jgi:hypothetical protein